MSDNEQREPWYKDFPKELTPIKAEWRSPFNDPDSVAHLEANRDRLYAKLEAGYERIEAQLKEPTIPDSELGEWERFWSELLREYERVCEELQRTI